MIDWKKMDYMVVNQPVKLWCWFMLVAVLFELVFFSGTVYQSQVAKPRTVVKIERSVGEHPEYGLRFGDSDKDLTFSERVSLINRWTGV